MVDGVAFIDVETTGLDPRRHQLWSVAVIVGDQEHEWFLDVPIHTAEPEALRVNRYYERRQHQEIPDREIAEEIAYLTAGRHLVGACPWFDVTFLEPFLRRNGYCPAWSHRLICVETLAAGHLRHPQPTSLRRTAVDLGLDVDDTARHTALGDARLARDVYKAICGPHEPVPVSQPLRSLVGRLAAMRGRQE